MDDTLKQELIKLGSSNPELRPHIRVVLAAMHSTTKMDIKMKNGDVVPKGTKAQIKYLGEHAPNGRTMLNLELDYIGDGGRDYTRSPMVTRISHAHHLVTGVAKPPTLNSLERMSNNAIATTPSGKRVEPDGWGPDGSPSWMLVMGII